MASKTYDAGFMVFSAANGIASIGYACYSWHRHWPLMVALQVVYVAGFTFMGTLFYRRLRGKG